MNFRDLLIVSLVLCDVILTVNSYKILTILFMANRSMRNFYDPILLELAKKGNSVTVISSTPATVQHTNIKELAGVDLLKMIKGLPFRNFIELRLSNKEWNPFLVRDVWTNNCEMFYKLPSVQNVLQSDERYDMIFLNSYMNECSFGLAHHLNTTTVLISTFPVQPFAAEITGTPSPLSYFPHMYFKSTSLEMGFLDRVKNLISYLYMRSLRKYYYIPAIEDVYRKYIPNAPGVDEIERNASLVMGTGHSSFSPLRPVMPDVVDELAGIHCRSPKTLPQEISDLIVEDGKEVDFIYFSFGSIVQGHQIPLQFRKAFISAFSRLKYRVLWKWEIDYNETEVLPPNVKLAKWFPQQDVLGHPKCKLFITHGGLSSLHEALYHGVPVIGLPFFGDQEWNLQVAEHIGVGVKLELRDVTEEKLLSLFDLILNGTRHRENMKLRSTLFHDRPMSSLANAVWWVEYVLRHGGATHLKSPARNLNLFQYYCIDILVFLLGAIFTVLLATIIALKSTKNFVNRFTNKPKQIAPRSRSKKVK